ncbi:MAG: hypothetical protein WBA74_10770 [Cyclobacteriaceae bacterium]
MMNQNIDDLRDYFDDQDHDGDSADDHQQYKKEFVYQTADNPRTVDFILLNGSRQNFNYSHYIKSWFTQDEDGPLIRVFFSTDTVTIRGYSLDPLYECFRQLTPSAVKANPERYAHSLAPNENQLFITSIKIEKHGG